MTLRFTISSRLLSDVDYWFQEGACFRTISHDIDLQRRWTLMFRNDRLALFTCGGGGVVRLTLREGRIATSESKTGQAARALHIQYGLKPDESTRGYAKKVLARGRPIDEALSVYGWPVASDLRTGPSTRQLTIWIPWRGAIRVKTFDEKVTKHRWLTGAEALKAIESPPSSTD